MVIDLHLVECIANTLIFFEHCRLILIEFGHFLLEFPCRFFLLTNFLSLLHLFAIDDGPDFPDVVVYFPVALVLFQLLQEIQNSLFIQFLIESVLVDLANACRTSITDLCFSSRMDSVIKAFSVYSNFSWAWL